MKKSMLESILLIGCSFLLCIISPKEYSYGFCIACGSVFLMCGHMLIKNDIQYINIINFNIIYLFSFFCCTYVFPLILMPIGLEGYINAQGAVGINSSSINICTSICTLFISIYTFAYLKTFNKKLLLSSGDKYIINNKQIRTILVLVSVLYIIQALLFIRKGTSVAAMNESPFLLVLYISLLCLSLGNYIIDNTTHDYRTIISENRSTIITSLAIALIMLYIGDRGPVISIGLIYLSFFAIYIHKIKIYKLVLLSCAGILFMFLVGATRGDDSSLKSGGISSFVSASKDIVTNANNPILLVFSDLTDRYIELYGGYYYTEKYGSLYPLKIIPILASPFPLMPSFLSEMIYGKPFPEINSDVAINKIVFNNRDGWFGTHEVIDIYMSWGILGIIIVSALQGIVFGYISSRHKYSLLLIAIYLVMMSKSLYLPRAIFYELYRPITWTIIIYSFSKRRKRIRLV